MSCVNRDKKGVVPGILTKPLPLTYKLLFEKRLVSKKPCDSSIIRLGEMVPIIVRLIRKALVRKPLALTERKPFWGYVAVVY